jgi:hypothetical protein
MADPVPLSSAGPIVAADGITEAERYLAKLCKRSFLSMWSYPGVFRDQKAAPGGKGDGKELCDLLVVFENHVIIFSDKDCRFNDALDLRVAWARWFKKAVQKSAEQVWGAERWIRQFPDRLFLDRRCTIPFPINLPDLGKTIFHRIVVAHDASRACRKKLGGSGSLMLNNTLIGEAHLSATPFTIGQVDPAQGYVHVFDDTTLDIVMSTLDTITDFTEYLTKKERFLTGGKAVLAAGEEELLAVYLQKLTKCGEHDFVIDENYDAVVFQERFWEAFVRSPERQAQIEYDRVSYSWDKLIEKFAFHAMTGTQYFATGQPLREQEVVFRFLAREPRTRRRLLAASLYEVLERSIHSDRLLEARVCMPAGAGFPYYVFLFLRREPGLTDEEYRNERANLLHDYCLVTKLKFPSATYIIGIASEAGLPPQRSEDFGYMDASRWSAEDEARAREIQQRFGLLTKVTPGGTREYEYPVGHQGRKRSPSRNSQCPCGSRKKFKNCHGKELFNKKGRRARGRKGGNAAHY